MDDDTAYVVHDPAGAAPQVLEHQGSERWTELARGPFPPRHEASVVATPDGLVMWGVRGERRPAR